MNHILETPAVPATTMERLDGPLFDLHLLAPEEALAADTPFSDLIRIWMIRRGTDALPEWSSFEFADFRGWHDSIIVSAFSDDTPNPEFRIVGEAWKSSVSQDISGLRFSDYRPRLYDAQFRAHFQALRDSGLIGWCEGYSSTLQKEYLRVEVLELPVRRNGPGIGGLIHVLRSAD